MLDNDLSGPQKLHCIAVPRVGGLGIVCGLAAGIFALAFVDLAAARLGLTLAVCALPVFGAGLAEDRGPIKSIAEAGGFAAEWPR